MEDHRVIPRQPEAPAQEGEQEEQSLETDAWLVHGQVIKVAIRAEGR
jgi:hypothetical protein